MAKKPAFLFYSNDFYEGTRTMLPEERACYVDLMVYQHQHDYIPNDIKRIAMYCVGVSEATLEATLEAKFKLCDKGWYNEKLQEVMNDYEEYSKDQSDNGMYGQFIKKLNSDKSIKNLTELKEFIKNVYTRKRLIEDLKINNNYEANLEALLKRCLNTRVESESEIINTNSSNYTNAENQKISTLQDKNKEKFERYEKTFFEEDFENFADHFKSANITEQEIKEAIHDFKLNKLTSDNPEAPYNYKIFKEWFKKYLTENRAKYVHVPKMRIVSISDKATREELHPAFKFYWMDEYTIEEIRERILSGEYKPKDGIHFDNLIKNKLIEVRND